VKRVNVKKRERGGKMKKEARLLGIIFIFILMIGISRSYGYIIDGSLNDWGIDLSAPGAEQQNYLDNHLPSGGLDIDFITEDNADKYHKWTKVGPLYSYKNYFDVEAIYFDNDSNYAYIAIIQGLPKAGYSTFKPGDIAIDADNNPGTGEYGYEFGLDILDGSLYSVTDWEDVYYNDASISNPWAIKAGTKKGAVSFVYSTEKNSHYVLEAAIPLDLLGLDANTPHSLRIHWTQECGNDYLTLNADVNPVPEPATLFLLGTGLIGIAGIGRRTLIKF